MRNTNLTKKKEPPCWFFTTRLNQETYVNVLIDREKAGNFIDFGTEGTFARWQKAPGRGYMILHYAVNGNELTLNFGDEDAYKALVKKIQGFEWNSGEFPEGPEGWLAKHLTKN